MGAAASAVLGRDRALVGADLAGGDLAGAERAGADWAGDGSSRLESHTALADPSAAVMNGLGGGPTPSAISSMVRPEAAERSFSCSKASWSPGRANASSCLI